MSQIPTGEEARVAMERGFFGDHGTSQDAPPYVRRLMAALESGEPVDLDGVDVPDEVRRRLERDAAEGLNVTAPVRVTEQG